MAYIPPHKRNSRDPQRPSPAPAKLLPEFENRLNLGSQEKKDRDALQVGKIIYADNSISRWWPIGLPKDGFCPPTLRLEPISCEAIDRKWRTKALALVMDHLTTDVNESMQSAEKFPWVLIAEKVLVDLLSSAQNVRSEMEMEKQLIVAPSFVARFGKVVFYGGPSVTAETICKSSSAEITSGNLVKKSFNTNVPSAFMDFVQHVIIPKIGFHIESKKDCYYVKVYDKCRPDTIISCKCNTVKDGQELEIYKIELNQRRHLVVDMSCLDKDLDLRLMLSTKRLLTLLTDEEEHWIRELIQSAVVDPDVKGGLRWPLVKESSEDRFSKVGVWHTKYKTFVGPQMRLKLRDADRFDFRTSTGESAREVTLKMTGISMQLKEGIDEEGLVAEMLQKTLKLIWDNFLTFECSFT